MQPGSVHNFPLVTYLLIRVFKTILDDGIIIEIHACAAPRTPKCRG